MHRSKGFSIAEILITLILLGVLATFTVPSLLTTPISSGSVNNTAKAKQVAFMVFTAYQSYLIQNGPNQNVNLSSLTPYMNYISLSTSHSQVVGDPPTGTYLTGGPAICGTAPPTTSDCYLLSNGGILWFNNSQTGFGGTNSTNAIWFNFAPDVTGSSSALQMWLTFKGNIYTVATLPTTMTFGYNASTSTQAPTTEDASWFKGF